MKTELKDEQGNGITIHYDGDAIGVTPLFIDISVDGKEGRLVVEAHEQEMADIYATIISWYRKVTGELLPPS